MVAQEAVEEAPRHPDRRTDTGPGTVVDTEGRGSRIGAGAATTTPTGEAIHRPGARILAVAVAAVDTEVGPAAATRLGHRHRRPSDETALHEGCHVLVEAVMAAARAGDESWTTAITDAEAARGAAVAATMIAADEARRAAAVVATAELGV